MFKYRNNSSTALRSSSASPDRTSSSWAGFSSSATVPSAIMFAVVSWPATSSNWPIPAICSAVIVPSCETARRLSTSSPGDAAFFSTKRER